MHTQKQSPISILWNIGTQVPLASGRISILQSKDLETSRFINFWLLAILSTREL